MAPVKFLVLSDTHNLELETLPAESPLRQPQPKVDVLIHCGDLTQVGGLSAYRKALRLLGSFDAELKLVIAGNHDISLDGEYWRTHLDEEDEPVEHDEAIGIMTGKLAQEMGVTYLTEGFHKFALRNGSTFSVYATPYQPECGDWAFSYKRDQDRFNFDVPDGVVSIASKVSAVPDDVDIMITHGPPRGILDLIPDKKENAGCDALLRACRRVRPLLHCFGHIHEGYGVENVIWDQSEKDEGRRIHAATASNKDGRQSYEILSKQSTLMVNASIMDDRNQPIHAPWLIELDL